MRKVMLIVALLVFIGVPPVFAEEVWVLGAGHDDQTISVHDHEAPGVDGVAGAKFDAPNLIGLTEHLSLGVEASKDLLADPLNGDTRHWFEDDHGYSAYVKVTYDGCWFNCN